jgi:hypothetical protein
VTWLEIPAHRVLEVEGKELEDEFDMYDDRGKLCGGSSVYLLFLRKDGKRFKFAQFGDVHGLSSEIALIYRRSERSLIRNNRF